jgi:ABC-type dipeptide/oligopeptide/nickel transport system permease component
MFLRECVGLMTEHRQLSVGDAVAIIALLIFIVGWIILWTHGVDDGELEDRTTTFVWLAIIGCPSFWAGGLISRIVENATQKKT